MEPSTSAQDAPASQEGRVQDWGRLFVNVQEVISKHLSPHELNQARAVCSDWRSAADFLTKVLLANTSSTHSRQELQALMSHLTRAFPRLNKLILNTPQSKELMEALGECIEQLASCSSLQDVELRASNVPAGSGECWMSCGPLSERGFSSSSSSLPDPFSALLHKLGGLTQLRRLKLHYAGCAGLGPEPRATNPSCFTPQDLLHLARLTQLQELDLCVDFFKVQPGEAEGACPASAPLRALTSLISLKLHGDIDGLGISFLSALPNLENLHLHNIDTKDAHNQEALSKALGQLTNLRSLSMAVTKMCRNFLLSLANMPQLQQLYLQFFDYAHASAAGTLQYYRGWSEFRDCFQVYISALTGLEVDGFCMDGSTLNILSTMTSLRRLVMREVSPPLAHVLNDNCITALRTLTQLELFCLEVLPEALITIHHHQPQAFYTQTLRLTPDTVNTLARSWPNLRSFHYEGDCTLIHPYSTDFGFHSSLRSLSLIHHQPPGDSPRSEYTPCLFAGCLPPSLLSLHLQGFTLRGSDLSRMGPRLPALHQLALLDYHHVAPAHVAALVHSLSTIQALTLEARPTGSPWGQGLLDPPSALLQLSRLTALRSLWLVSTSWDGGALRALAALQGLHSLALQLPHNCLQAGEELSWLSRLHSLKWLGLSGVPEGPGARALFARVQRLLPGCAVEDLGRNATLVRQPRTGLTRHLSDKSRFLPYKGVEQFTEHEWILRCATH